MKSPASWRSDLRRLMHLKLPLLPCGAGAEGKGPIDPATGKGLTGWNTASFTVAEITAMNSVVRSVGARTGAGLLCFDLDGGTAIELALEHGCDPTTAQTWQVHRTTDPLRLKVIFRLTPEQQAELGEVTAKAHTKPPQDGAKGEAVEVFHHPGRQILLLGEHLPSAGAYIWPDGLGPEALALISPQWYGLAVLVAAGSLGSNTKSSNTIKPRSSSKGEWRSVLPCPTCGRNTTGYCSQHRTDGTIRCFHGSTFSPEYRHGILRVGQTITGSDGITYGYCSTGPQDNGDVFSTFRVHKPRNEQHLQLVQPAPEPSLRPQPTSRLKWGQRKLSHSKAMACFDRCIEVQAKRERNSLKRRARLLKALHDLGLGKYINRQEIAQRVLEAKDHQMGQGFAPLTAADRLAMEQPAVRWVLPGVLPAGDMSIVGGRPKVGKTRLATAMAAAVLNGTNFLGHPEPQGTRPVILVTDDQGDGDTAQMLTALGIWDHPQLIWSRHFRLTERDINALLEVIAANPEALVVIDSLRSISRALQYGENDPEIGAILYDLKAAVMEANATLVLIHHASKSADLVGVEALSGHSTIAGAANSIITLHYLTDDRGRPLKHQPQRRVVREARTGDGFDLVITRGGCGAFEVQSTYAMWVVHQEEAAKAAKEAEKEEARLKRLPEEQQAVLEILEKAAISDRAGMTLRQVCEKLGADPDPKGAAARRVRRSLSRLEELKQAWSTKKGKDIFYLPAPGLTKAQKKVETLETVEMSSDANESEGRTPNGNVGNVSNTPPANVSNVSTSAKSLKKQASTEHFQRFHGSLPLPLPAFNAGDLVEVNGPLGWQSGYVVKALPDADGLVKVSRLHGPGRPAHVRLSNLRPQQEVA